MGLDLQPDGLIAGLAGHSQPDRRVNCWACWAQPARQKTSLVSERKRGDVCICFSRRETISYP